MRDGGRRTMPGEFVGCDTSVRSVDNYDRNTGIKETIIVVERIYHYRKRFTITRRPDFPPVDDLLRHKESLYRASVKRGDPAAVQESFHRAWQEVVDAVRQAKIMATGVERDK